MADPMHLNLLPGYESEDEEVEPSSVFQHTSSPDPHFTSPSVTRSNSPEPAKGTSASTSPDLLPGYESDEEVFQAAPVPRIVVQSPTPSPCSPPARTTSSPSPQTSKPAPISAAHVRIHAPLSGSSPHPPTLNSLALTTPPPRRSQRLIERKHIPVGNTTPPTPPAPAPRVQRTIPVHRRTAPSGPGVPMIYQDTPLIRMARMIERNLEASVEVAEAFKEFVGVGKQGPPVKDVVKKVVERKLEEIGKRYGKRKAGETEEDEGDEGVTEVGGEGEKEAKKMKMEDE